MALAAYLAVAVAVIIAIVVVKLIRGMDKTSALSLTTTCSTCGRKKGLLKCPHCQSDSKDSIFGV